jgi:hypothetical protein
MKKFDQMTFMILLVIISLCLAGCQPNITQTPTSSDQALSSPAPPSSTASEIKVSPTQTVTNEPVATEIMTTESNGVSYQIDISLNYPDHSLMVIENIDYTNNTSVTLSKLPLIVPPAYQSGVFSLISFQAEPPYDQSNLNLDGALLNLSLQHELVPGESIQFELIFQLQVPRSRSLLGYTDRQLLLADWYPFIPPFIELSGWLINDPGPVGEYLAYHLADFSVNLKLSPPMEGLIVAASTPVTTVEGNSRRYNAEQVRNISFAFSPDYVIYAAGDEQVSVQAYILTEHTALGQRAADLVKDAWKRYESLYSDNPRQYISVIEADIDDGMEYDGTFFISDWYFESADKTPKNYFELLLVHETAHQWFYALIPNDPAHQPWLDESLATYSELLFLEQYHPDLINWWWDFRVNAYNPSGFIDSTIYEHNAFRPYVNAVYLRGVSFLDALRQRIGDASFFAFLEAYSKTNDQEVFRTTTKFFRLLDMYTNEDLSGLISGYFKSAQP